MCTSAAIAAELISSTAATVVEAPFHESVRARDAGAVRRRIARVPPASAARLGALMWMLLGTRCGCICGRDSAEAAGAHAAAVGL